MFRRPFYSYPYAMASQTLPDPSYSLCPLHVPEPIHDQIVKCRRVPFRFRLKIGDAAEYAVPNASVTSALYVEPSGGRKVGLSDKWRPFSSLKTGIAVNTPR
jgi:hypothetical protein